MAFLVAGEAVMDMISEPDSWRFEAAPGGSPLNVAVGLAAAGVPVRLASEVGPDMFGTELRAHLRRHGVDDRDLLVGDRPTGLAFARVGSGTTEYHFRLDWRWSGRPDLIGVRCLHIGSLGAVVAPGAAAVRELVNEATRLGVPISYDPNPRPTQTGEPAELLAQVEALVAQAQLVKASEEDLAQLYPRMPPLTAAAAWARSGPRLVIVTRGVAGAVALYDGGRLTCSAPQVPVVDTVGAGDAFTAGMLTELAAAGALADPDQIAVAAALRRAVATATAACLRRGAGPGPAGTVAALLARTTPRP